MRPYSQATRADEFILCAGGIDPKTGKLVEGGIQEETRQTIRNFTDGAEKDLVVG